MAEVVESKAPGFAPGDLVWGDTGWQDYAVAQGQARHEARQGARRPADHLSHERLWRRRSHRLFRPARMRTAESRARRSSSPPPPDRSARSSARSRRSKAAARSASRAVQAKCELLTRELGFDAAVDYKAESFSKAMRAAVPQGIDVYFDNVGGNVLEACLFNMNNHGRIACCGAVSQYDSPQAHGPRGVPGLIVTKRLTMRGFIVMDFEDAERKGARRSLGLGRIRPAQGPRRHHRRLREPAQRPHRASGRRECRQADGEGRLARPTAIRQAGSRCEEPPSCRDSVPTAASSA